MKRFRLIDGERSTLVKRSLVVVAFAGLIGSAAAEDKAIDPVETLFRDALYQEEVKGNSEAALALYEEVSERMARQRELAATALFRQGECLRKLDRNNEAGQRFQTILKHYPDQERMARLARQNLIALGLPAAGRSGGDSGAIPETEAKEIARLKRLIANSPDLLNAAVGESARPPLHAASGSGQLEVAAFLLKNGADIDLRYDDRTSIDIAAAAGHLKICELLVAHGADLEGSLVRALEQRRQAVARFLLKSGAGVKGWGKLPWGYDKNKWLNGTALGMACSQKLSPELVQAILDRGADPDQYMRGSSSGLGGTKGVTALHLALKRADLETVRILLEAGADPRLPSGKGGAPPVHIALASVPEAVDLLLAKGAVLTDLSESDGNLLHAAVRAREMDWIARGLEAGIDIDAVDIHGQTPLHLVMYPQTLELAKALLEAGANPNVVKGGGSASRTPLGIACHYRALTVVERLLEAGADPNLENGEALGQTLGSSRRWSENHCWPEGARLLLNHGANPMLGKCSELNGANPISGDLLDLFGQCWTAAHHRFNPNRKSAVWYSSGPGTASQGHQPSFYAVFSGESGLERVRLSRLVRDRFGEAHSWLAGIRVHRMDSDEGEDEIIPVDFIDWIRSGAPEESDLLLTYGDILEIPPVPHTAAEDQPELNAWFKKSHQLSIAIEVGEHRMNNRPFEATRKNIRETDVARMAGVSAGFFGGQLQPLTLGSATGALKVQERTWLQHGEKLRVMIPDPEPALSDDVLQKGIFVSTGPEAEGPFWPLVQERFDRQYVPTVASLVVLLSSPSGLPGTPVDWSRSTVRRWREGVWDSSPVLDTLDQKVYAGTHLVLESLETEVFELGEAVEAQLSEVLTLDWLLFVNDLPAISRTYTPPFFRAEKKDGHWYWEAKTPGPTGKALVPRVEDLVAAEYLSPYTGAKPGFKTPTNLWLDAPDADAEVRVVLNKKTPPTVTSPTVPRRRTTPGKRRVILPPGLRN
ncbi:MAG: ankyrin repeat domain-containing protein [Verrucomicrobiota bacterium]